MVEHPTSPVFREPSSRYCQASSSRSSPTITKSLSHDMVVLGGLEVLAAGYLLSEFNKDKVEQRERRKRRDSHRNDDRPHSNRPPRADNLRPPSQGPLRPSSAPPNAEPGPTAWQQQAPGYPGQPQPHRPPQNFTLTHPQQPHPSLQFQQGPPPNSRPGPGPPNGWQPGPHPINYNGGPPPPNLGPLNRPNTFHPQTPQHAPPLPQQGLQHPNSFPLQPNQMPLRPQSNPPPPIQHQQVKPPPQGPLTYVDTKTGRVQHNLYPPDHPMARGFSHDDSEIPRDRYGDEGYGRTLPGDIHTGMVWSEFDEVDLAYGHDYSSERPSRHRREPSFERRRPRGRSSPPPAYH